MRLTHRGTVFHDGPTTAWSDEAQILLDVYAKPVDAMAVKIIDAVELAEAVELTAFEKIRSAGHVFQPKVRNVDGVRSRDGRSIADILKTWKAQVAAEDLYGQLVPYPISYMITQGRWSITMMLSRFRLLGDVFPSVKDWPPPEWLKRAKPVSRPVNTNQQKQK